MTTAPIHATWDGESLVPLRHFRRALDASLIVGQSYLVELVEERSHKAHAAYFATVAEAWKNLPEGEAERFPSPDHLRKYALIKTGFAKRRDVVAANNNEAMRFAATVKELDPYSITLVSERAVSVWTAESQSYRAMGKARFMQSQEAVRDFVAAMIGVDPAQLERETGRAA